MFNIISEVIFRRDIQAISGHGPPPWEITLLRGISREIDYVHCHFIEPKSDVHVKRYENRKNSSRRASEIPDISAEYQPIELRNPAIFFCACLSGTVCDQPDDSNMIGRRYSHHPREIVNRRAWILPRREGNSEELWPKCRDCAKLMSNSDFLSKRCPISLSVWSSGAGNMRKSWSIFSLDLRIWPGFRIHAATCLDMMHYHAFAEWTPFAVQTVHYSHIWLDRDRDAHVKIKGLCTVCISGVYRRILAITLLVWLEPRNRGVFSSGGMKSLLFEAHQFMPQWLDREPAFETFWIFARTGYFLSRKRKCEWDILIFASHQKASVANAIGNMANENAKGRRSSSMSGVDHNDWIHTIEQLAASDFRSTVATVLFGFLVRQSGRWSEEL